MRENRTYGSEGGVAIAIPTPIEKGGKTPLKPCFVKVSVIQKDPFLCPVLFYRTVKSF